MPETKLLTILVNLPRKFSIYSKSLKHAFKVCLFFALSLLYYGVNNKNRMGSKMKDKKSNVFCSIRNDSIKCSTYARFICL